MDAFAGPDFIWFACECGQTFMTDEPGADLKCPLCGRTLIALEIVEHVETDQKQKPTGNTE